MLTFAKSLTTLNQTTQMVKNESFNNVYMTKQCALFRHTLPLTKQQMDKHICKKRKGKDYDCMEDEMKKTLQ